MIDPDSRKPLGIYLHVPFCRVHCPYCDFYTYPAGRGRQDDFVQAVMAEIGQAHRRLDPEVYRVETVYFGGGTPALLASNTVTAILGAIADQFQTHRELEITLEANPREITPEYLQALVGSGVNRVSVGVQSFNNTVLRFLGRDHLAADADRALDCLSRSANWSADLIFGSARHDLKVLGADLDRLLAYRPHHVSLYQLTIEPQTRFGSLAKRGSVLVADVETQAEQYELVCERLERAGFEHYEVSNFALPGYRARHNGAYWKRTDYLGLGPSASSLIGERRTQNVRSLPKYVNRLRQNVCPVASIEVLTPQEIRNERIWLGLRTSDGVDRSLLSAAPRAFVERGRQDGLLFDGPGGQIVLTRRGMAIADSIASHLLLTD